VCYIKINSLKIY